MATFEKPQFGCGPQRFEAAILARSVIALPLIEQINQESAVAAQLAVLYPKIRAKYNAAVFLHPAFPGGVDAALTAVRGDLLVAEQKLDPRSTQAIDAPDPEIDGQIAFATLDGAVIRFLQAKSAAVQRIWPTRFEVTIDINLNFKPLETPRQSADATGPGSADPRQVAKKLIKDYIEMAKNAAKVTDPDQGVDDYKTAVSNQYVFARLEGSVIQELVKIDNREAEKLVVLATKGTPQVVKNALGGTPKEVAKAVSGVPKIELSRFRTIHHIWPDFEIHSCVTSSIRTVKADAAQRSFSAHGEGITWAVLDTGIDALHPHFKLHSNIDPASPYHADFTGAAGGPQPLLDDYGHGTHVAGIIAGQQSLLDGSNPTEMLAVWNELDGSGKKVARSKSLDAVSGMAPKCKLVSLKVLDEFGIGRASNVIAAISHVQLINGYGRDLKIHGVNLSLGHAFDPKWFACGYSPLCVEVNRLVKSGVVVVIAAGNTGYGSLQTKEGVSDASLDLTINDPGNAEYAITVGSTHRDMPHMYGVSYFSSKGPTGDGRAKPDLLAPGEKIISCAAANSTLVSRETESGDCFYFENSGTSMAAPHVSGVIAAFLSIRREYIGEAEKVKHVFTSTATDLGRDRYFQGAGLVDLMRAIQAV